MPEAPMDKHNGSVLSKNKVGGTGEASIVEPKPKPLSMQEGANYPLGLRVLSSDA